MRSFIKYGFIVFGTLPFSQAVAQRNLSEEVNVVRPYKPILAEASKIITNPEIKNDQVTETRLEYKINPVKIDSTLKFSTLSAENMKSESISKLYRSYVKLGGGTYSSSLAEVYLTNLRSKEFQTGVFFKHNAAVGSVKNMDYSENQASLFGKRIFPTHTISLSLNYDRDVAHFYGYDHELFKLNRRGVRQQFDYFDVQSELTKNIRSANDKINYRAIIKAYTSGNSEDVVENRLVIGGSAKYDLFHLETGIDLSNYKDSLEISNNVFQFNPSIRLTEGDLAFSVGLNLYQEFGTRTLFHAYPDLRAQYELKDLSMLIYAGVTGKIRKNNFRDFYSENPFLAQRQAITNTNEKLELFAGIKGSISSKTAYRFNLSYLQTDNAYYFVNDTSNLKRMNIIYDGNGSLLCFTAELTHQQSEKLKINALAKVNNYTTDTLAEAWHKPLYEFNVGAHYLIGNKFIVNTELIGFSTMKAPVYAPVYTVKEIKGGVDFNIGVDYRYSKIISVFLKLNNLTNYKRERYLYYPTYGFNGMIGAAFSF